MRRALLAILLVALVLPSGAGAALPRDFFGVMANGPLDAPGFDLDAQARARRPTAWAASGWRSPGTRSSPGGAPTTSRSSTARCWRRPRARIGVLGLIVRAPSWASGRRARPSRHRATPADYAAFAKALVARYGPGG